MVGGGGGEGDGWKSNAILKIIFMVSIKLSKNEPLLLKCDDIYVSNDILNGYQNTIFPHTHC